MINLIGMGWTQLKIAFDVKDPLQPTGRSFDFPQDSQALSPDVRLRLTICNLYSNNGQSIEEIAQYFGVTRSQVITALIQEGLLKDQRRKMEQPFRNGRRRIDRVRSKGSNHLAFAETTETKAVS